jgi:DnaJ-class molecular chaperone
MKLWPAIRPYIEQYIKEEAFQRHVKGNNVKINGVIAQTTMDECVAGDAVSVGSTIWYIYDFDNAEANTSPADKPPQPSTCPTCNGTGLI